MNILIDKFNQCTISFDNLSYGQFVVIEGYFERKSADKYVAYCVPVMYRKEVQVKNYDHGSTNELESEKCYFLHSKRKYYSFSFIVPQGVDRVDLNIRCEQGILEGNDVSSYISDNPVKTKSHIKSVAHLGYTGYAPRNTLSAFELAGLAGFRECVLNVNRTKDNKLVALHNDTIDESSTGNGLIGEMTYYEANRFDYGVRYNPFYKGEKLPLINDVIELLAKYNVKPVLRLHHNTTAETAQELYNILKRNNVNDFTVKAFRQTALENFYEVAGDNARYGYCINREFDKRLRFMKSFSAKNKYIDMLYTDITKECAKEVIDSKLQLEVWIINAFDKIIELSKIGVSGFTTDLFQFDNYIL